MSEPVHIIGKTIVDLKFNNEVDGWQEQQKASAWVNGYMLPAMNEWFDALPKTDVHVKADRVLLSVLIESEKNWEEKALKAIKAELMEKLEQLLHHPNEMAETWQENFFRVWLHFLKTGFLPHLSTGFDLSKLEQTGLYENQQLLESIKPGVQKTLKLPVAQVRLVQSSSGEALEKVFVFLLGISSGFLLEVSAILPSVVQVLKKQEANISSKIQDELQQLFFICVLIQYRQVVSSFATSDERAVAFLWIQILKSFGLNLEALSTQALPEGKLKIAIKSVISIQKQEESKNAEILQRFKSTDSEFFSKKEANAQLREFSEFVLQWLNRLQNSSSINIEIPKSSKETWLFIDNAKAPEKLALEQVEGESESVSELNELLKEGIYINNAGLLILCPLLPTFFSRIGIYDSKEKNLTDRDLAVALLYYLSMGSFQTEEYKLAFEKIICGSDAEKALVLPQKVSKEITDECRALLDSVIEHWSALKNTSIEGLRQAFLQRNGKIQLQGKDEFFITVEQKSYDMLLEQLPWSINMIKLPWLNQHFRVQWF